jgi:hypothetical protein
MTKMSYNYFYYFRVPMIHVFTLSFDHDFFSENNDRK